MESQETQGEETVAEPAEKKRSRWVWVIIVVIVLIVVFCFCSYILVGPAINSVFDQIQSAI
jgi:hypothetical protein